MKANSRVDHYRSDGKEQIRKCVPEFLITETEQRNNASTIQKSDPSARMSALCEEGISLK